MPAILLCQEHDELKVPSSPPRRLSRSSIDLRDLEAQHEREKIFSQNVSESVSSIYHCFNSQMLRYSESEPINAHIKALENQFSMKSTNNDEQQQQQQVDKNYQQLSESKSSMNKISFMNNFDHSAASAATRENDMNLISSASIIKDNHQINRTSSSSSNNGKKSFKKKMLASSDSDFFSLLRYNSVKLRRMNCFSIGSTSGNDAGGGGGSSQVGNSTTSNGSNNSGNENKPQNMIYALSDSDFLIRVSDNNKKFHLNNERKFQAIVNKSDILNYLNKSFDHNLLDNNSAQHNHQKKLSEVKHFGDPDFFNVDKLKKVFEENPNNSMVATDKINKKETVSLPPLVNSTSNELNLKLNNSRSIDTVLLNIRNTNCNPADKNYTFKLLHDFSPKAINQEECLTRNLKDVLQRQSTNVTTSSGSEIDVHQPTPNNYANNNNLSTLSVTSQSAGIVCGVDKNASTVSSVGGGQNLLKPVNLNDSINGQQNVLLDLPSSIDSSSVGNVKYCDSMNPACLDDKNIGKRKRTASNVTYNVNVIDFQSEDEPEHSGVGVGHGKRSNSSTSE